MSVRITTITERTQTVLKVDGRLERDDVDELMRLVQGLDGPAALDLAELQTVDREALVLLREILSLDIEIRAVSPYVKLLLELESNRQRRDKEDMA
jgi:ABC-type transporter Mla MlaB component